MREPDGFTLIEALVAAFVAALVFGFLVSWMAQNLDKVGAERRRQHALQLAEQRAREYDLDLRQSGLVEAGAESGEFAEPDADLGWEIEVEPWRLPLPADLALETSPSPLFEPVGRAPETEDPPLHRVSVRVFRRDDPQTDLVAPFVFFGVVPGASPAGPGAAAGTTGGAEGTLPDDSGSTQGSSNPPPGKP